MAVRIPEYMGQTSPTMGGINARAPNAQVYDAIGPALQRLGQVAGEAVLETTKVVSEGYAREADNEAVAGIQSLLYDPENGYLTRTGRAALDTKDGAIAGIDSLGKRISGNIKNEFARSMFERAFTQRAQQAKQSVLSYAGQQAKVYNVEQAKARSVLAQNAAVNEWNNPEQYETNKRVMLDEAAYGLTGAAADVAKVEALQGLHAGVLNRMFAQDQWQAARDYFDRADVQAEMPETMKTEVLQKLRQGSVKTDSLDYFMALSGSTDQKLAETKSAYRNGTISADVYDAAVTRINAEASQIEASRVRFVRDTLGSAQQWVLENPNTPLLDMPSDMFANVKSTGLFDDLQRFATYAGQVPENPQRFLELRLMDPLEFMRDFDANSPEIRLQVSQQEYSELQRYRIALNDTNYKAAQATNIANQTISAVKLDLRAAGLNTNAKPGSDQAVKLTDFSTALVREIDEFIADPQNKGMPPTKDQAARLARNLLLAGEIQKPWYQPNPDVRLYEVPREQIKDFRPAEVIPYTDVPKEWRDALIKHLDSIGENGRPVREIFKFPKSDQKTLSNSEGGMKIYQTAIERLYTGAVSEGLSLEEFMDKQR